VLWRALVILRGFAFFSFAFTVFFEGLFMRNDPYDDVDDVPSLTAKDDDDDFELSSGARERTTVYSRTSPVVKVKAPSTGPLWALIGALAIAFCGLGWWSFQQITLMGQQLVATQESFARISEEAAGRLQDISGKVVATESVVSEGEALRQRIKLIEDQLADQDKQQEGSNGQKADLEKRLAQLTEQNAQQQATSTQLQEDLKNVALEMTTLKSAMPSVQAALPDVKNIQASQDRLDGQLKALSADIATLKKNNSSQAIDRIEQELVALKSEQDRAPTPSANSNGPSTAEFDAYRAQVTRSINTLNSQIQNLAQQVNAPR
jgi:hypothetical protein